MVLAPLVLIRRAAAAANASAARSARFLWALLLLAPALSTAAEGPGSALALKLGQGVTFGATLVNHTVTLGSPRRSTPEAAQPKDGEIAVSIVKHGRSPYAELIASEKTSAPIDFVATGLIGDIKIDEVVVCGRLGEPVSSRIASGSWRVSLSRFTERPAGRETPGAIEEGGLPCPK
jgi:hypothetical protein